MRPWIPGATCLLLAAVPLRAQCPDGLPPPCSRRAPPAPGSVAVLYFDNLSSDTSDAVLADGLTEEIIVRLQRLERLEVKPRSAVLRFRGQSVPPATAARVLAVANLVSGEVRRVGARVRVTAELVRVQGEQLMWSTSYIRPVSDAFDLSAEIAESVATSVRGRLLPAERAQVGGRETGNSVAYRHFVSGNTLITRRSRFAVRRAIDEYQAAIAADPRFAAAHARLSLAYSLTALWQHDIEGLPPSAVVPAASRSAAEAVRLDSASSEAWLAMAMVRYLEDPVDPTLAFAAFDRSVRLNPSNAEALHQYGGRLYEWRRPEAVATERRSLAIDPSQPTTLNNLAADLLLAGDRTGARAMMDSAVAVEPDYPLGLLYRGLVRLAAADSSGALADFAAAERQTPDEWEGHAAVGYAAALRHDSAAATAAARAWDAKAAPWFAAGLGLMLYLSPADLWLAMGRRSEAMDSWEHQPRSARRYWAMRDAAARDPILAGDVRFQGLLAATAPPPSYR